jgi:hypothetical protein
MITKTSPWQSSFPDSLQSAKPSKGINMTHVTMQVEKTGCEAWQGSISCFRRGIRPTVVVLIGAWFALMLGRAQAQTAGNPCIPAAALPITGTRIVNVATETQLQNAMGNLRAGDTVVLANGTYKLTSTLHVNGIDNVTIRGKSGCDDVILVGRGMDHPNHDGVLHGIWSNARSTVIAHLTIRDFYNHPIIFNAGAQSPHVYNVKLLNAGLQFIKSNPTSATEGVGNGIVEYSVLEYTTGPPVTDHGPGAGYTNGLSIHAGDNWVIRRNLFKNFHAPDSSAWSWNPALLVWNHSSNTLTEGNTFINIDRAVAYGIQDHSGSDHQGGTIRNNFFYLQPGLMSATRKAGSDAQIIVWDSPGTKVYHNTILTNSNVFRSIEFRFNTAGAEARNNLTDVPIGWRDGASFSQSGNLLTATASMFVNPAAADLHLKSTATAAIDQVPVLATVTDDTDGHVRPFGSASDIGADEFVADEARETAPALPPTGLRGQ